MNPSRTSPPAFREVEIDAAALARNIDRGVRAMPATAPRIIDLGAHAFGCDPSIVAPVAVRSGCTHGLVGRVSEALELAALGSGLVVLCDDPGAPDHADALSAAGVLIAHRTIEGARGAWEGGAATIAVARDSGRGAPGIPAVQLDDIVRTMAATSTTVLVVDYFSVLGAAVYGLDAGDEPGVTIPDAEAVMTLWAPVVGLKPVGRDEGVSYGYRYRTTGETMLALVSLGYADGVDRAAGNLLDARVGGVTRSIAGRVAMDAFVLDVGADAVIAVGDRVVLWGSETTGAPAIADAARRLGTHSAELATRLTARPRRRALGGES